jgi:hypothetical protein
MKGMRPAIGASIMLLSASLAAAQSSALVSIPPAPIPRPDIAGSVGWLNVNKSEISTYNDWYNRAAQGALTFGWYWSTHLKTELEASVSTREEFFAFREEFINGSRAAFHTEHTFSTRRITLSQQYQFGENAWFHPHLAAGVDMNWERIGRLDREVYLYNVAARGQTLIRHPVRHPNRTDLHVRPLVAAGFKGYMTQRSFVRSDIRAVVGDRVEEVIVRFGIGVDF